MAKSKSDEKKEKYEENIYQHAIALSKTKKKLTRDILAMMDGEIINRLEKDRPDIIVRSYANVALDTEVFIGIEHFLVEQVSERNKKGTLESIIKKKHNDIENLIDKSDDTHDQEQLKIIREKLLDPIFDIAARANSTGIPELKEAFHTAYEKHLQNIEEYRKNLARIADEKSIRLAFLIEMHCNADDIYLNNGRTVEQRHTHLYPVLIWMVEELERSNPELLDYIVLYQQNSVDPEVEDIVAIETKDVRGSLRKQGIIIYDYCDDPSQIKFNKIGLSNQRLEYSVEVKNKDTYVNDMMPDVKKAYKFKKNSIPFVAPRSIQEMMYSNGKARFCFQNSRLIMKSEFTQNEVLRRFNDFIKRYPIGSN